MKNLYITDSANIVVDYDTQEVNRLTSEYERINRIYLAPEDMHVIFGSGETHIEEDVKAGDIIIVFYNGYYEKRMVVVQNEDWKNNLIKYHEKEQKEKEEWALKHKENDENNTEKAG